MSTISSTTIQTTQATDDGWWLRLRPRLTLIYVGVAALLLLIGATGQLRLLSQVGNIFGGFTWTSDPDSGGQVIILSIPPQLPAFPVPTDSITNNIHIVAVNGVAAPGGIEQAYHHVHAGDPVTYTTMDGQGKISTVVRPAVVFTLAMWWQTFGLTFIAGASWLIVGGFLLATTRQWAGAVEGITLLPPAFLLLLYSHWGNIQQSGGPDLVIQLLWIPSFALLGAAFIHLSLTYRPEALSEGQKPRMVVDLLPYLPLLALLAYEWSSLLLQGHVPLRPNLLVALGYGVLGGLISFGIGITSLLRIANMKLPWTNRGTRTRHDIPLRVRHRLGDLLTLWIGGVGLGFCFGVLPILLMGQTLLPLPIFYTLATVYPLILFYAIRSLRLIDRLHITLEQREQALVEQRQTARTLQQTNDELQKATSLLLHADAHLRSLLSQRIHDQPKQQALRIRSLLGYWQHKLRLESERDSTGMVTAQPVIEALGKVRKISEELESDLRGLQLLIEDVYQRRSLGLKLHLEKLIREDLPLLHPESPLKVQADLWALDALTNEMEQGQDESQISNAISYTVTQALLNVYNHAAASFANVRATYASGILEVMISDDGRGFDSRSIPPEKTSMFKARLIAREVGGTLEIRSLPRPQPGHGTTVTLCVPLPRIEHKTTANTLAVEPSQTPQS